MQRSATDPSDFIASLSESVRQDIETLDKVITKIMQGLERVMWEGKFWRGSDQQIIGYGDYTHKNRSGNVVNWFIIGLALQKNYISVYVSAVEDNQYLTEQYAGRLGKVKTGKSNVSFKRLDDVNLEVLLEMIAKARDLMTSESS